MATRKQRHAEAVAKREQRLADERAVSTALLKKAQEKRYWEQQEIEKKAKVRQSRVNA